MIKKGLFFTLAFFMSAQICLGALVTTHPRILIVGNHGDAYDDGVARIRYRCGAGVEENYHADIRSSETFGSVSTCYGVMKTQLDGAISGGTLAWDRMQRMGTILGLAICYWVEGSTTYSDSGIAKVLSYADSVYDTDESGYETQAMAMAYDYFYPELTAGERSQIEHHLMVVNYVLSHTYDDGISARKNIWNGHCYNEQAPVAVFPYLAIAGEPLTDATVGGSGSYAGDTVHASSWESNALALFDGFIEGNLIPAWNQVAGTNGNGGNSMGWGTYSAALWNIPIYMQAWRDAGLTDYVASSPFIQYGIKHMALGLRPNKDQVITTLGDDADSRVFEYSLGFLSLLTLAHLSVQPGDADIAKWAIDTGDGTGTGEPVSSWVKPYYIMNYPSEATGTPPAYTDGGYYQDGTGSIIYRTGWDNTQSAISDNFLFAMASGPYYDGHQHLNAGEVQLYYKGDLLPHSGAYPNDTSGTHYLNYYDRTVASNGVLIYDPLEPMANFSQYGTSASNDGGQRSLEDQLCGASGEFSGCRSPQDYGAVVPGSVWYDRGIIGEFENTASYTYALTDTSGAYWPGKASSVKRGFIAIKDANDVIIWDWIQKPSDNTGSQVRILFHSMDYPAVSGAIDSDGRNIHGGGEVTYSQASMIDITDSGQTYCGKSHVGGLGHVFISPIYPEENNIYIVGGPAADGGECQADSYEFFYGGSQYNITTSADDTPEMGVWRTEIRGDSNTEHEMFLNILHVTDSAVDTPNTTPISATVGGLVGVQLKHDIINKVVLITPTHEHVATTVEFSVTPDSGALTQCYVVGLDTSGDYSIGITGTTEKTITIDPSGSTYQTSQDGLLVFSVAYSDNSVALLSSEGSQSSMTCYTDSDGDGYGTGSGTNRESCLAGEVENNADCNDSNAAINPGATEVCGNGVDEDCSGVADACQGGSTSNISGIFFPGCTIR